ncbi:hypothetical protein PV327_007984 [Microctonus hyperodae]|uniref:Uncharacterized protein n=1 Tax=Microctonus hyperodae TaxID=165561 RepID=A0AA39KZ24_MICHY|nr:hypothetical protein PV327_007984 [Microctonus hyperodae]
MPRHIEMLNKLEELYTGLNTSEKYFNDNSRIKRSHQTPILSLSQNYLIFEKSSTLNPCQTSSITNHTSYELILEWEKDVDGVFTVDLERLRISSGKSGHFRISFKPQSDRGKCSVRDIALYGTIKSLAIEHAFTLICLMALDEYTISIKKPIEIAVRISAMPAIGSLKAEPDEINLMEIPYNELRKFNFHVFNVSEVEMCFKLISKPAILKIIVSLALHRVGFFKLLIMYAANESQNSITICTINYTCTLPMIKIIDLQYHQINLNHRKLTLWRLLKINLLNKITAEMDSNTKKILDIYMP